jgi:hypothetical protein
MDTTQAAVVAEYSSKETLHPDLQRMSAAATGMVGTTRGMVVTVKMEPCTLPRTRPEIPTATVGR